MIIELKSGGAANINNKEFICDTVADLPEKASFGDMALVLENSGVYICNSDGDFVKFGGEA